MKYSDYREKKRRGEPGFPISYYFVNYKNPQYVMEAHWHNELEFIRILEGEFYAHLDNEEIILKKGDCAIINGGCIHSGTPTNCVYECVVLDLGMLRRKTQDAMEKYVYPLISAKKEIALTLIPCPSPLFSSVNELFLYVAHKSDWSELKVYSLLYEIIYQLYSNEFILDKKSARRNSQREVMSVLLNFIDTHYNEQITLALLAKEVNVNEKYLCRLFYTYTSKTPITYVNELRVENACHDMKFKGASVTEAAMNSGFNDLSYFSKVFKTFKSITPAQYKKEYCKQ